MRVHEPGVGDGGPDGALALVLDGGVGRADEGDLGQDTGVEVGLTLDDRAPPRGRPTSAQPLPAGCGRGGLWTFASTALLPRNDVHGTMRNRRGQSSAEGEEEQTDFVGSVGFQGCAAETLPAR